MLTKKSAWTIYTALLMISLAALMLASLFFLLEIRQYGFGNHQGPLSMNGVGPAGLLFDAASLA